jgi:hypothetical protein
MTSYLVFASKRSKEKACEDFEFKGRNLLIELINLRIIKKSLKVSRAVFND